MRGSLVLALSYSVIVLAQQGKWFQCGGQGWNGGTSCSDGWTCQVQNPYYSQCLPASGEQTGGQSSTGNTSGGGGPDQNVEASQEVTNNNGNVQSNGYTSTASTSSPTGGPDAKSDVGDDDLDDDTCDTETETDTTPVTQAQTQPKDGKSGAGTPVIGTPDNTNTSSTTGDTSQGGSGTSQGGPGTSQSGSGTSQGGSGTSQSGSGTSQGGSGTTTGSQGGNTGTSPAAAVSTNQVDGKFPDNLATTTNYDSGTGPGACGCSGRWQSPGSGTVMTAAASFPIYGDGYCGAGCGKCFKLTNMGYGPVANSGADPAHKGDTIIIMVTNSCPVQGNEQWCSSPNQYGYTRHFDIASTGTSPNGWGNVVVSFEPVGCGQADSFPGSQVSGGLVQNYGQCKCAAQRPASTKKRAVKSRWARLASYDDLEEF